MFNRISKTYDLINRVLSFGIDRRWRKISANIVADYLQKKLHSNNVNKEFSLLDVATGTGDFLFAILNKLKNLKKWRGNALKITAIDIEEHMLCLAREKMKKRERRCVYLHGLCTDVDFQHADAINVNYPDNNFDVITSAFGVRNFYDLETGLANVHRMLKKEGLLVILEFSAEEINLLLKPFFIPYLKFVVPILGGIISRDFKAYDYLNESARAFPSGERFKKILCGVGFSKIKILPLTFGLVTIYIGHK
ncbi:MAG: ubiquinone/menaquinone biosynthesis methyltransferase [Oligoflexia bacterium]|nr:ubiquinone/menaquinone biosynthesis methyltransferase [Oligoflexia bacterium]